jgi:allantoin racemase
MKIKIINPNTTDSFTLKNLETARAVANGATELLSSQPSTGAASIESHFDEAVCAIGILEEVLSGEKDGVDGYVIACFGDPGVHAAREAAKGPVVGMSEAAMHLATLIAAKFSVVTLPARTRIHAERVVSECGFHRQCASVRAIDLPVLDLESPEGADFPSILTECRKALEDDGAEAIVLGCAGMADLVPELSSELEVPVIEGVAAAVKMVESLVALQLSTSRMSSFEFPVKKPYTGAFDYLSPDRHFE